MYLLRKAERTSSSVEGATRGPASVSLILDESPPGGGPRLHRHPYDETWIVEEGRVQVWIGDETAEAAAGDIVTTPPNAPHKFENVGQVNSRMVCIHSSRTFITEWLE
ncbi:MAG TPA: cupin domain-containing protein [Chloroflexota bacterium]|nr:cupin domain-containing protein [Chloroflexota bacterium]